MPKKKKRSSMRDKARQKATTRNTGGSGFKLSLESEVEFFIPKKGTFDLDIIPYEVTVDNHPQGIEAGDLWYERTIFVHYGIGAEEKAVLCRKTIGERCPICEHRAELLKDADVDENITNALKPKERQLFNVIDLNDEDKGVQLWEMSYFLFGATLEEELREGDEDWGGFADLEGGYTLKTRFSKKKLGRNEFLEVSRIDFDERDDYEEDILDDVQDLDSILNVLSYKELQALYLELDGSEEDDEEERPKKPSRKKKKKKEVEEEPEEDDVVEEDEDDEEEEKKPKKRRSRKKKKADPEPEEEENEDQDDEDEEEPAPKKRRGRKKKKADPEPEPEEDDEDNDEDGTCEYGATFGKDCETLDECEECEDWEACRDLKDSLDSKKRKKKRKK